MPIMVKGRQLLGPHIIPALVASETSITLHNFSNLRRRWLSSDRENEEGAPGARVSKANKGQDIRQDISTVESNIQVTKQRFCNLRLCR